METFVFIERAGRVAASAALASAGTVSSSSKTKNSLVALLTGGALMLSCQSVADVTVQEQTTMNFAIIKAHGTSTERIAGDKKRTETEFRCEGMMSLLCGKVQDVEIVRLDRGVTWKEEPKKKRYTETPLPTPEQSRAAAERMHAAMEKLKSCPQARQQVDTSKCELSQPKVTVEKTDEVAKLAGHDAQRTNIKLTQSCKSKDAATQACELIYSFDVWLTRDEIPGVADRRDFQRRYLTHLGLGDASAATSAQLQQYLAPYADTMKQLAEKAGDLKGYPLKTTFRFAFGGASCGGSGSANPGAPSNALSDAGKEAGVAGANSAEQAARWGTIDKVEQSTGSSAGGYVAGSAAGAFAGKLIGGLFAKKSKPEDKQPAPDANASTPAGATTVAEFTVETTAVNTEAVPAEQFEVPADWTKRVPDSKAEPQMPNCPTSSP